MSCQLDVVSVVVNIAAIRRELFPERSVDDDNRDDEQDWSGGWPSWNDDAKGDKQCAAGDQSIKGSAPTRSLPNCCWLQECVASVSPVGDVLVLGRNNTVVWLNQKWDSATDRSSFFKVRSETVASTSDDGNEQDSVTAILCLPLVSQKRSAHGRQDWTAVLVGFSLGAVKVYTEEGTLLLVQRFDQSPVISLKCRSFEPPRYHALAEQHEELVVVYKKSVVVVVQGLGLYQTLRACRNQAAKAAAAGGEVFEAPPLEYKKWVLHDHDDVNDCEGIGTVGTTAYDRMVAESILRGSGSSAMLMSPRKASSSAASLFVATGTCPYVGFYYAVEGSAPLLVSEAMMAAAQKLSSYFSGFFVGGRPPVEKKQPPKLEPPTLLPSRFELRDLRRSGITICSSPNRRLSAITDEFGRVTVVDNHEGVAVRIFKGYREAQCGWIDVTEEQQHTDNNGALLPCRVAQFLVIYSRRRGILEVWVAQQGPRVAAFSVGKTATLVYCNYSILGATSVKSVLQSWSQSNRCYLIDVDGIVRTISVPFHCALSSGNDRGRARDLHLLEKVRLEVDSWSREGVRGEQKTPLEVADIVLDMKTASVRQQALDLLLKSDDADSILIQEVILRLLENLQALGTDSESMHSENRLMIIRLQRYLQLLHLYDGVIRFGDVSALPLTDDDEDLEKPLHALSLMLHLGSEHEVDQLLTKVDRYFSVLDRRKRIRFKDTHGPLGPGAFMNCFEVVHEEGDHSANLPMASNIADHGLPIHLSSELSKQAFTVLARFMFMSVLKSERICYPDFLFVLLESDVSHEQLLSLLIECWLSMEDGWSSWRALCNLHSAVICLSSQTDDGASVNAGYNEVSPWWSSVRNRLRRTSSVAAALTAAIVCRGASVTLVVGGQLEVLNETKGTTSENEDWILKEANEAVCLSDWEGVHLDTEQWSLLVKQLEDLVSLATLVDSPIPEALCSNLSSQTAVQHPVSTTVDGFLERGRGGISEFVSQWLTRLNLPTLMAVLHCDEDGRRAEACSLDDISVQPQLELLKASFAELRLNFPHSLQRDVLLANCSWEFAALWNADKEESKWIDGCVSCLAACSVDAPHRRGLASRLWHTFFGSPFSAAAQLVEKVGKAPKERLCRKNVGMSDTALEKFLDCCERLLDTLIKVINLTPGACAGASSDEANSGPAPVILSSLRSLSATFRCEEPWQDMTGPVPLVDVALETREPDGDMVGRHRDLAIVLYAVFAFSLRGCRPLSLYDTRNQATFFHDLSSKNRMQKETPDLSVINARVQFLCRLLSAVVQTISVTSATDLHRSPPMSDHAIAVIWFGRAINLGLSWQLDVDQLRRHLVCELYSSGLDSMAEEVLPSVVHCVAMGSQLILIAGRRINNALHSLSSDKFVQKSTFFTSGTTNWLNTLERHEAAHSRFERDSAVAIIAPLLTYVVNAIPEHQAEHKLALNLMEGLHYLLLEFSASNDEKEQGLFNPVSSTDR